MINPWRVCMRVTVVVLSVCVHVCVCLSVSLLSHLTSGVYVHPKNVTYSVGNVGRKICGVCLKLLCSRAMALPALYGYREVGHFLSAAQGH